MKRKIFLIALVLMVMMGTALFAGGDQEESPAASEEGGVVVDEWEFPMLSVLTGPVAFAGKPASWGIAYAAEKINAAGGIAGVPVKIIDYDTAFDTAKAIVQMTKAVNDSLVVFGPMDGPGGDAAGQVAADEGVPFIAAVSFPDVREKYKPYGIAYMTDSEMGDYLAAKRWISEQPDIKKVTVFYTPTDPSIVKCYELSKKAYEEEGVEVVGTVEIQTGQLDLGPSVVKAMGYDADGYQLLIRTDEFVKAVAELDKRGMSDGSKILGTFSSVGPHLFTLGEGIIEDCYFWNKFDNQYQGAEWQELVDAYKEDFDGQIPQVPPCPDYYNALWAVKDAIETLGITGNPKKLAEERQAIAEYLFNSKEYDGIQGPYKWVNGEKKAPVHFFQVQNNELVAVQ